MIKSKYGEVYVQNFRPALEQESLKASFDLSGLLMTTAGSRAEGKSGVWTISNEYNLECFGWLEKMPIQNHNGRGGGKTNCY